MTTDYCKNCNQKQAIAENIHDQGVSTCDKIIWKTHQPACKDV